MPVLEGKHVLIIVENLPLPFDRRVWQEANTLRENGAEVSIICPKAKGYTASYECLNGIHIYRHPLPLEASGATGYLWEYASALFWEFVLSWKIFFKRRFHVIQGCNPPDLIFLVALWFRPFGVKYLFDHHDINPELFIAKYGRKGAFYNCLLWAEWLTFKAASHSIATNESYREIALTRGGMRPHDVTVVRSGPKLDRLRITAGNPARKKGRRYLVGYVGVIGEQEGIDLLLQATAHIVRQRDDVQFAIVGGGTEVEKLKQLSQSMGLAAFVDFYGRVDDETMIDVLNTADVCVNPDKPTVMNNLSTMNKIMEYMALKKPIVQFDLKEGRVSAQDASLYANNTDPKDFADKIVWLLEHEPERRRMGEYGYNRIINELSWDHEKGKLLNVYRQVLGLE